MVPIFKKAIFTAASPNTQIDDVWVAKKALLMPWSWFSIKPVKQFEMQLSEYLNVDYIHTIDSGRAALNIGLKALGIGENDEVIIPSFTCVVVANAVRWTGATPVYLDTTDQDFNADYSTLADHVSDRTKIVVVQHTFGKRVDVMNVRKTLDDLGREDILILEDFAHTIHRNLGLKGDIGFLTFGIEKVMSSVRGGAVITNNEEVSRKVDQEIENLPRFPRKQLVISLLNPIFWWIAIPLHSVGVGRFTVGAFIRGIWRKLGFLGIMVEDEENRAKKPDWFPVKFPGALARLGIKQLSKLDYYNAHRKKIAGIYDKYLVGISDHKKNENEDRVYLRYPIQLKSKEEWMQIWNLSRSLRVTLGNWFAIPLYGSTVSEDTYQELCYVPATTPTTTYKCERVLNLPTSVNISEARAEELARNISELLMRNEFQTDISL
jgi:perosamine synthetase